MHQINLKSVTGKSLYAIISHYRSEEKYTLVGFCKKATVSTKTVYDWGHGTKPLADTVLKVVAALQEYNIEVEVKL